MENKSDPLVSIIIPAYNSARFLRETLDSSLNQTYTRVEVILVNDGSTDNTPDIVPEYSGRIVYINQDNSGLSAARNIGFLASKGEYIVFLDADDVLLPHMIETLLPALLNDPSAGVAYGGYMQMDVNGMQFGGSSMDKTSGMIFRDMIQNVADMPVGSLIIRRCVFAKSGIFDPMLCQLEDVDMWLRLAYYHKFVFVPEYIFVYRQSENSMSRRWAEREPANRLIIKKWTVILEALNEPKQLIKPFRKRVRSHRTSQCIQDAFIHYKAGHNHIALRKMIAGVIRDPRYLANRGVVSILVRSMWGEFFKKQPCIKK